MNDSSLAPCRVRGFAIHSVYDSAYQSVFVIENMILWIAVDSDFSKVIVFCGLYLGTVNSCCKGMLFF